MTRKKSSFLTFICSLIPGAGEMYMGFLKRGTSIMSIFFFIMAFAAWLDLGPLTFLLPVIWFYSFFQTHGLKSMPDDEFYALEDDFVFTVDISQIKFISSKYKLILGCLLVVLGISILWNQFYGFIVHYLPIPLQDLFYSLGYRIPQSLFGIFIIALGIGLVRGKKQELDKIETRQ